MPEPPSHTAPPAAPDPASRWRLLRRALVFARPYRGQLTLVGLLTLTAGALNALEPLLLKEVFDALGEEGGGLRAALAAVLGLLTVGVVREIGSGIANWQTWRTRLEIHHDLLEETVTRLHRLPVGYHRGQGVGAVMTRLDRGIQGFVQAVSEVVFNLLPAAAYLALGIYVMARLEWRLLVLLLLFAPLPALLAVGAAPRQIDRERRLLERWAGIYSRFNEVLSGIVTVRSFAMEDAEKERFLRDVGGANRIVARGIGFDSSVGAAQNVLVALARVSALAYGAWLVIEGEIGVGTLVAFLGYVAGVFGPVQGLTTIYRTLSTASVAVGQVFEILDAHEHLGDAPDATSLDGARGEVCFEDVHFRYDPAAGRPMLAGIDLRVAPGETLALVGPSGSGKSTLMALLERFYDPDRGRITIDGHDLRTLRQRSVRQSIAVVLQDAVLFNDTVRANIAYGRPQASSEEIEAAARAANADGFIREMPQGYDTVVGERGARLSLGERQRVAIARALLKDAPIVILDEATSALDAETEAQVSDALDRLLEGRTAFVIAHRLSTVVGADRIAVLKDGRIAELGTHRELLDRGGYYASLVARQTRGLLPVAAPAG